MRGEYLQITSLKTGYVILKISIRQMEPWLRLSRMGHSPRGHNPSDIPAFKRCELTGEDVTRIVPWHSTCLVQIPKLRLEDPRGLTSNQDMFGNEGGGPLTCLRSILPSRLEVFHRQPRDIAKKEIVRFSPPDTFSSSALTRRFEAIATLVK